MDFSGIDESEKRQNVLGAKNLLLAFSLHFLPVGCFWAYSYFTDKNEELPIPMDLTVVVVENLDGNDEEPPPEKPPEPEPPAPQPPPPPPKPKIRKPEEPKPLEQIATNFVKKVEKKEDKKKVQEKPKDSEKPKKTKEQLREERDNRLKKMRNSATTVRPTKPQPNGRTDKKTLTDAEIRALLNQGYKPGRSEQLAGSEMQRCVSLIKMALDRRWAQLSPSIGRPGTVVLQVGIDRNGQLVNCRIAKSCGDSLSDKAALTVAKTTVVSGLSQDFISQNQTLTINYTVEER